jgi:membrane associated rhomboid family serine protease
MFFFPFRADINLYKIPLLTIAISLLCIAIYYAQYRNEIDVYAKAETFCEQPHTAAFRRTLLKLSGSADTDSCRDTLLGIHVSQNRKALIKNLANRLGDTPGVANADLRSYYADALSETYSEFSRSVPSLLTTRLWYSPTSWSIDRMLTATVAHGSWWHLIGNLFFFFAFAASVEIILGPLLYLGVFVMLALGTHTVYSLATLTQLDPLPTLGLSGVIMGIVALFAFFIPTAKIRCFLWLFVFFRRISIPAWILAGWYIGWDVYHQSVGEGNSGVNLVAHLSGAAIGLTLGLLFFRAKRHWAAGLVRK